MKVGFSSTGYDTCLCVSAKLCQVRSFGPAECAFQLNRPIPCARWPTSNCRSCGPRQRRAMSSCCGARSRGSGLLTGDHSSFPQTLRPEQCLQCYAWQARLLDFLFQCFGHCALALQLRCQTAPFNRRSATQQLMYPFCRALSHHNDQHSGSPALQETWTQLKLEQEQTCLSCLPAEPMHRSSSQLAVQLSSFHRMCQCSEAVQHNLDSHISQELQPAYHASLQDSGLICWVPSAIKVLPVSG